MVFEDLHDGAGIEAPESVNIIRPRIAQIRSAVTGNSLEEGCQGIRSSLQLPVSLHQQGQRSGVLR